MAARLAPDHVQSMHESLHHFVSQSPWNDFDMLRQVRNYVLPAMQKKGPVTAWIVDETDSSRKHSFRWSSTAVLRPVGKKDNCQVAVSLSVATATASLPIAWRLYLSEEWPTIRRDDRRPVFPSRCSFRPSRKLRWHRSGKRLKTEFRRSGVSR